MGANKYHFFFFQASLPPLFPHLVPEEEDGLAHRVDGLAVAARKVLERTDFGEGAGDGLRLGLGLHLGGGGGRRGSLGGDNLAPLRRANHERRLLSLRAAKPGSGEADGGDDGSEGHVTRGGGGGGGAATAAHGGHRIDGEGDG